jgi:hypothetical protein
MFKRYLLSSVAAFAPAGEGGGPDDGDDRVPEPTLDDDETSQDPVDEADDQPGDDADDQDDQGEDDDQGDADPDAGRVAARPSRGDRQMGALRAENRRLAEEQARLTRQLDEVRRGIQNPQQPAETAAQRAERLALLSPDERADARIDEALARHNQQQQHLTNQLLDASDKSSFDALSSSNPLLKKLAPDVERRRQELYQRDGNLVPRGVIATYLIGERVLAQQSKGKPAAQQRRQRENARPVNAGSDVTANRSTRRSGGDTASDIERRYGDVQI